MDQFRGASHPSFAMKELWVALYFRGLQVFAEVQRMVAEWEPDGRKVNLYATVIFPLWI